MEQFCIHYRFNEMFEFCTLSSLSVDERTSVAPGFYCAMSKDRVLHRAANNSVNTKILLNYIKLSEICVCLVSMSVFRF